MEILKIAICEDLSSERDLLQKILAESQYPSHIDFFENGENFIKEFKAYKYDLIFMDIYMDNLTGIDVIKKIREIDKYVTVAFVTSSLDFALESYRLDAVKYIEKPATKKSIEETLKIADIRRNDVESLVVRTSGESNSYPLKRIICLEQKGRTALIRLTDGETVSIIKKISELEDQLEEKSFFRCHKCYIVNLEFVTQIDQELLILKMTEGENVHISRTLFWTLKKEFQNYLFNKSRGTENE